MFHCVSNFKTDEDVIPNKTGIISLNDLYLAIRHRVLFGSINHPKSAVITR